MLVRAPLVKAEQDRSIRIQDLTPVVMARRSLRLAQKRLIPFEAAGNVAYTDDCPCAFHRPISLSPNAGLRPRRSRARRAVRCRGKLRLPVLSQPLVIPTAVPKHARPNFQLRDCLCPAKPQSVEQPDRTFVPVMHPSIDVLQTNVAGVIEDALDRFLR